MATITLFANRINNMPDLFDTARNSVSSFKTELESLRQNALGIDSSICDLDATISSLRTSTDTQEAKITALESVKGDAEVFASETVTIDEAAAEAITSSKDDFYDTYDYMKPDSEKSGWEKFCDGLESVGEWCKEHWKLLVTVVIVIVAIVCLFIPGVNAIVAGWAFGSLLLSMLSGALIGAVLGGVVGGVISAITGTSILEGIEEGAFSGAIAGLITGGMGYGLSAGGKVALTLGKTVLIGAGSGAGSSLISDIGDIIIKGEKISFGEVIFNAALSGLIGGALAAVGYGISKGFNALKAKFGKPVTPLENGPYVKDGKPNGRPGPSKSEKLQFETDVYNKQVGKDGILRDPHTGEVLDWRPGEPRTGKVDFGHRPGKNNKKVFADYINGKISLADYKAFNSNPKNFWIEAPSANRGHAFENSVFDIIKDFPFISDIADVLAGG